MSKLIKDIFKQFKEDIIKESIENSFNIFFKKSKIYSKKAIKNSKKGVFVDIYNNLDKKDIIIFSPNYYKINNTKEVNYKNFVFPYDKIFIEYPLFQINEEKKYIAESSGILLNKFGNDIIATLLWTINYIDVEISRIFPSNIIFKSDETGMITTSEITSLGVISEISFNAHEEIISVIKKVFKAIEIKEYTSYKKWTPTGIITKEIIYSHDVKSHKRHFWSDSGRFKIPLMSKEELERNGYSIDELVFRSGELRRDVPFKVIGQFKVGGDKKLKNGNRKIILFEKRIFRQEEKVLQILKEIFPDSIIRRHDRRILKGLELDFLIYDKRIAFEYDGEQHYIKDVCENVFKSDFEALKKRDRLKDKLCHKKNIKLIRIKYNENITKYNILKKIKGY